jgi:hypothetical protein
VQFERAVGHAHGVAVPYGGFDWRRLVALAAVSLARLRLTHACRREPRRGSRRRAQTSMVPLGVRSFAPDTEPGQHRRAATQRVEAHLGVWVGRLDATQVTCATWVAARWCLPARVPGRSPGTRKAPCLPGASSPLCCVDTLGGAKGGQEAPPLAPPRPPHPANPRSGETFGCSSTRPTRSGETFGCSSTRPTRSGETFGSFRAQIHRAERVPVVLALQNYRKSLRIAVLGLVDYRKSLRMAGADAIGHWVESCCTGGADRRPVRRRLPGGLGRGVAVPLGPPGGRNRRKMGYRQPP